MSEEMQELDSQLDGQESDTTDTSGKKRMILRCFEFTFLPFPGVGLERAFFRIVYDQYLSMLSDYQYRPNYTHGVYTWNAHFIQN